MQKEEAAKILNVEPNEGLENIVKKYEHLFNQNDPERGGSSYIREKIVRAKDVLEAEHRSAEAPPS